MSDDFPAPMRLDPLASANGAFCWEGAQRGELLGQQCGGCASYWHPPRSMCPKCHSLDQRHVPLSGKGTIYSWTMPVHPLPIGFTAAPVVILVQLEEGIVARRLAGALRGASSTSK
jgi:uncharacterized protein